MTKVIGIVGYMNDAKTHFGAQTTHLEYISKFGIPRIILPKDDILDLDMLYLPGGLDLNPASYGQVPSFNVTNTDVYKQYFYDHKLKAYIDKGTPVFGVCLGSQQLAAMFGSKLTQDLKYHEQSKDRWATAHKVTPTAAGSEIMKCSFMEVNSHHHQGVLRKNLSDDLEPLFMAKNEEFDKIEDLAIVEAFRHKQLPIYAVQWHPEELYDNFSSKVIRTLLNKE